jgi:hypothetical protein
MHTGAYQYMLCVYLLGFNCWAGYSSLPKCEKKKGDIVNKIKDVYGFTACEEHRKLK